MKIFSAWVLLIVSVVLMLVAFNFRVTAPYSSTINLELLQQQLETFLASLALFVSSIILFASSKGVSDALQDLRDTENK